MRYDFDAAIFDMDGTLLDTMPYRRYASLEYLLAHRLPVRSGDLVRMIDTSARKLLYEIAEREGFALPELPVVVAELEGFMKRHYQSDSQPKPDAPAFLRKLRGLGLPMCVGTGAPRENARIGLDRAGILDFFRFVTDIYEFGIDKSDPEFFRSVARRMGTVPERCVVFEDALYAMRAAKAAGCSIVAIEEETARLQRQEIRKIADVYIRGYAELL